MGGVSIIKKGYLYKITNRIDGKIYLGSTINFKRRKSQHLSMLRKNKHHSHLLQKAFNECGEYFFDFEIICESDDCKVLEDYYFNEIHDFSYSYNVGLNAIGGDNFSRLSEVKKKELIKLSTKTLKENRVINVFKGSDNPNWKGGVSINYCKCGKKITQSAKTCMKCKKYDRCGEKNSFYGKTHSKETREKLRQHNLGKVNESQCKKCSVNGIEYDSLSIASRKLNINASTILHRIRSNNEKYKDYFYLKNKAH